MHIWIRAEQRQFEKRCGITPAGAAQLLADGFKVTVEKSPSRVFAIEDYAQAGCAIAAQDAWVDAPDDAIIFGLKELDPDGPDLRHRHIMFGHAYKGQADGPALLGRFKRGGGALYDLEYLLDENKRRVAAFGYWAGYAGAAIGIKAWIAQQVGEKLGAIETYADRHALLADIKPEFETAVSRAGNPPNAIVIGAKGRVGTGATDLCEALDINVTKWDMDETAHGGPFPEILEHGLFVNCILANENVPVFVPKDSAQKNRALRVIADVACDPDSAYNPIPIYSKATNFDAPIIRVADAPQMLDVMAIDNLPSLLPLESSEDFAGQLLPYIRQLNAMDKGVWAGAFTIFEKHSAEI